MGQRINHRTASKAHLIRKHRDALAERYGTTQANRVCNAASTLSEALAIWRLKCSTVADMVDEVLGGDSVPELRAAIAADDIPLANWISA